MEDIFENPEGFIKTLAKIYEIEKSIPEQEVLSKATVHIEQTGYDNWDGGTDIYTMNLHIPVEIYGKYSDLMEEIEKSIIEKVQPFLRQYSRTWMNDIIITPTITDLTSEKESIPFKSAAQAKHLKVIIGRLQSLMIEFVTDGRANVQTDEYVCLYADIDIILRDLRIENPNPHRTLDIFWNYCRDTLETWASRRSHVQMLYADVLLDCERFLRKANDPRYWRRVNKMLDDDLSPIRKQWAKARDFIFSVPPDYENAIKESINSVESALKILQGTPKGTMGKLIKAVKIDKTVRRILSNAYGVISDKDYVRHGGVTEEELSQEDAEFFLEFAAVSINYLKRKLHGADKNKLEEKSKGNSTR